MNRWSYVRKTDRGPCLGYFPRFGAIPSASARAGAPADGAASAGATGRTAPTARPTGGAETARFPPEESRPAAPTAAVPVGTALPAANPIAHLRAGQAITITTIHMLDA